MRKDLIKAIQDGNVHKFYVSKTWRRKRKEILERDNNECQKCKRRGRFNKATIVHHKIHLRYKPDLALTDINLISLCDSCHNEEHPEKLNNPERKERFINEERWE